MAVKEFTDPTDGLVGIEVGQWAKEKHQRLRRYIHISQHVRKKFNARAGATYIELFAGPGRSRIKDSDEFIDGSPLVALDEASVTRSQFSAFHIADLNQTYISACKSRLLAKKANVFDYFGDAKDTATRIANVLNKDALHFAFIDPFKLYLPFEVIQTLANLKRMDMLIHVSVMDLQRNLKAFIDSEHCELDDFTPGWRGKVDVTLSEFEVRMQILQHWLTLIRALDMNPSQGIELVSGPTNQPLYWLVFVSRHPKAGEFWEEIRRISPQSNLQF